MNRRALLAAGAWATLAPGVRATAASAAPSLLRRGDRLFLTARLNGVAVEALLDSAAEATLVDPAFAARLGLAGGTAADLVGSGLARSDARQIDHVRIEAAGVSVPDATVAVVDLSDVGRRLVGRRIDAVVGREIFDAAVLMIDVPAGVIRPLRPGEAPRGVPLPLTERYGIEEVPVSVEDHPSTGAAFDLGNGTGVIVARAYADRIGLLTGRPVTAAQGGGLGGARPRQRITLRSLTLAGRSFANVTAHVDDAEHSSDVNIGVDLLQHFRMVADFAHQRIWLEAI